MNTNLLTIMNVLAQKSGAIPPAPNTNTTLNTLKSAQNLTDNTTAPDDASHNNTVETKNNIPSKENKTFNDTLDEKINSQTHSGVKEIKEQNLDQLIPQIIFPSVSGISCFVQTKPAHEGTELFQQSDKSVPLNGLDEILAAKPVASPVLETAANDNKLAIDRDNTETVSVVNNQATAVPIDMETTFVSTDTETPLVPPDMETPLVPPDMETPLALSNQNSQQAVQEPTVQPPMPRTTVYPDVELPTFSDNFTATGKSEITLPPENPAFSKPEIPLSQTAPAVSTISSDIEPLDLTPEHIISDQQVLPKNEGISLENSVFSGLKEKSSPVQPQQNLSIPLQDEPENTVLPSMPNPEKNSHNETLSDQSPIHRMDFSGEQITAFRAERQKNLPVNEKVQTKLTSDNKILIETANPSTSTEHPPLPAAGSKTAGIAHSTPGPERQIQESISNSYRPGTQQIVIRLDPPDLGRVTIKFIEQPDGITGVLHVENTQTKDQIQQALPEIIQNLQNSDISIKKMEVVLTNQQQYNTSGEQSGGYNSPADQQNPHGSSSLENPASYNEWIANSNNIHEFDNPHIQSSDNSINMLI